MNTKENLWQRLTNEDRAKLIEYQEQYPTTGASLNHFLTSNKWFTDMTLEVYFNFCVALGLDVGNIGTNTSKFNAE